MNILVINAGSSSVKFKLYDMKNKTVLAEGNAQRVGLPDSELKYVDSAGNKKLFIQDLNTHDDALRKIMELLTSGETKVIDSIDEISAVGHRISMGGAEYRKTAIVDDRLIQTAESLADIAPLHNPPQVGGIKACRKIFGDAFPMAVGFDTAFHHSIPEKAYIYGIPYEYTEKYCVRRFGFHGLSYQFVIERYDELTNGNAGREKVVVCHLGGGASASAIKNGECIDNTFGLGTGQGLVCGSRAGDFDHTAIGQIMRKTGMSYDEVEDVLHKKSGILGISGISSDERELEDAAMAGNKRAKLALDVMAHNIKKYIGAYAYEMGGLDTLIFTGGIGENSDYMRSLVCEGLEGVGIKLDGEANVKFNRTESKISEDDSNVDIWIIPTNEELVIAQDTYKLVKQRV